MPAPQSAEASFAPMEVAAPLPWTRASDAPPRLMLPHRLRMVWRIVGLLVAAVVVVLAIRQGLALRQWTWQATHDAHFYPDITKDYHWGTYSYLHGYLNTYDDIAAVAEARRQPGQSNFQPNYNLDIAPLRLLLIDHWVAWTRKWFPWANQTFGTTLSDLPKKDGATFSSNHTDYQFFAPLLRLNMAIELIGAIGTFLLVRHWVIRNAEPRPRRSLWAITRLYLLHQPLGPGDLLPTAQAIARPFRGCLRGLLAALLLWFSPAMILSGYGWPAWDLWVVPPFIWAIYLASLDLWFCCGVLIAAAAMFKGQQLLVAPVFVLWPLFMGKPAKAIRWIIGFAVAAALLASPWLLTYAAKPPTATILQAAPRAFDTTAIVWIFTVLLATLLTPFLLSNRFDDLEATLCNAMGVIDDHLVQRTLRNPIFRWVAGNLILALVCWPFVTGEYRNQLPLMLGLSAGVIVASLTIIRRYRALGLATVFALAMFSCAIFFHGNMNWARVGWLYGTRHFMGMTATSWADNLPAILDGRFHWRLSDIFYRTDTTWLCKLPFLRGLPSRITLDTRTLLIALYLLTLVLCAGGMAMQFRRNDSRFLVAMTTPWLLLFAFLPQMHERYLLFAAAIGCTMVGTGVGVTLLGLLLTVQSSLMMLHMMLSGPLHRTSWAADGASPESFVAFGFSSQGVNNFWQFLQGMHPDAGWIVVLGALIFLRLSLSPRSRPTSPQLSIQSPA